MVDRSQLYDALSKAQGEMKVVEKNAANFRNKYADLTEIVSATRPVLLKYGLCVIQRLQTIDGTVYLQTILAHNSGQEIDSMVPIRIPEDDSKTEIQAFGSIMSYLRRYSYAALICCVMADGSDDDGQTSKPMYKQSMTPSLISEKQTKYIEMLLKDRPQMKQKILEIKGITSLSDLKKSEFDELLEKIKGTHEKSN